MFPQFETLRAFLVELQVITDTDAGRWRASLETPPPSADGPPLALFVSKEILERLEQVEERTDIDRPRLEFILAALESYLSGLGAETVWSIPAGATPGDIPGCEVVERFSEKPEGDVLGLAGRGIRFDDTLVKPVRIFVSKGTAHPVAMYAERMNGVLEKAGRGNLALAAAFDDALLAATADNPLPAAKLLRSIFAVLDQADLPGTASREVEYILEADLLPYLASQESCEVEIFPAPGRVPTPVEFSGGDYEVVYVASPERPSGSVQEIKRRGIKVGDEVIRTASVSVVRPPLLEQEPVTPEAETRKIGAPVSLPEQDEPSDELEPEALLDRDVDHEPSDTGEGAAEDVEESDPVTALIRKLLPLHDEVKKYSVPLPGKALAFISKSQTMVAGLSSAEREGDSGLKFLTRIIDALDSLRALTPPGFGQFIDLVDGHSRAFEKHLESRGITIFPNTGDLSRDNLERIGGEGEAYTARMGYSRAPQGEVFEIVRRGIRRDGKFLRRAEVKISAGPGPMIYRLLDSALEAVKTEMTSAKTGRRAYAKAYGDIRSYISQIENADSEKETTLARYTINSLHDVGGGRVLQKAEKNLVKFLTDAGFTEIIAMVNRPFDETYPPSKYERKKISSEQPENHIVKVLRRGFLDRKGIPVQKTLLAVSAGQR